MCTQERMMIMKGLQHPCVQAVCFICNIDNIGHLLALGVMTWIRMSNITEVLVSCLIREHNYGEAR